MTELIRIEAPLKTSDILRLTVGDSVLLNGVVYTARDAAHAKLVELLRSGQQLPFEPEGAVIYYVGPCPAKPGQVIWPAGPTTSSRMDTFVPELLEAGVRGMIGKGGRSDEARESIRRYQGIYFAAAGGAGAYLARRIVESQVVAFEELGPEAIHRLILLDFPAIVAIDAAGRSVFDDLRKRGDENHVKK